jgi:hypothetical protein
MSIKGALSFIGGVASIWLFSSLVNVAFPEDLKVLDLEGGYVLLFEALKGNELVSDGELGSELSRESCLMIMGGSIETVLNQTDTTIGTMDMFGWGSDYLLTIKPAEQEDITLRYFCIDTWEAS